MPLYEYYCEQCDTVLSGIQPLKSCKEPIVCTDCGQPAERTFTSAPRLNTMRSDLRKAHQTNERSAHAPRTRTHKHVCGSGCNHSSHNTGEASKPAAKAQPGKRPWMLGH